MLSSVSESGAVAASSAPDPQSLSPAGSRGPGEAVPELPGLSLALFPPSPPRPPPRRSPRPGPHQNTPLYKRSQQPSGAESATNPNGQQAHQAGVPPPRERAAKASPTGSPPSRYPNDVPECPASPSQTPRGCCKQGPCFGRGQQEMPQPGGQMGCLGSSGSKEGRVNYTLMGYCQNERASWRGSIECLGKGLCSASPDISPLPSPSAALISNQKPS